MIQAIVFDLDGTLYASGGLDAENRQAAVAAISESKGVPLNEAELMLSAAQSTKAGITSISRAIQDLGVDDSIFKMHQTDFLNPEAHIPKDDELVSLVRAVRRNFKIALHTNTRRNFVGRTLQAIGFKESDFDLRLR